MKKLEKLYLELKDITQRENDLILQEKLDVDILKEIILQKKVIRDKIEKTEDKNILSEEKEIIKEVIKHIIQVEEDNQKKYKKKMDNITQKIKSVNSEKKLKETYKKLDFESKFFDSKK